MSFFTFSRILDSFCRHTACDAAPCRDQVWGGTVLTKKGGEKMTTKKVFPFDAETNGLYGPAFSIAAIVRETSGRKVAEFVDRCPITGDVDGWVAVSTAKGDKFGERGSAYKSS
jgi:hypothetical protein